MSDIIVTIPGTTDIVTASYPASSIVITFPASNYTTVTVIDRGILYGVQGPSGQTGGVNTINGQSGNVNLLCINLLKIKHVEKILLNYSFI